MSKHTPGPWSIHHEFNVLDENGRCVASGGGYSSNLRDAEPENRANAMLIAAAPDLLAVCIKTAEWFERAAEASEDRAKDTRFPWLSAADAADAKNFRASAERIRAVIAKAEGR